MKRDKAGLLLREYCCVVTELEGTHLFGTCKQITTHYSFKPVKFVIHNSTCSVVWKSLEVYLGAEIRLPSSVRHFFPETSGNPPPKKQGCLKLIASAPTMTVASLLLGQSSCSYLLTYLLTYLLMEQSPS
jgi:hypothetical protein